MSRIDVARLIGFVMMAAPMAAFSQTETLDYYGSPFTSTSAGSSGSLGATLAAENTIPENTGQIVLSAPLGDNLSNVAVAPSSYSFDSNTQFGGIYLSSQSPFRNAPGNYASFLFSTNASGMITGWSISVVGGIFGGTNSPSSATVTISNSGDSFSTGFSSPSCAAPNGGACYSVRESNTSPGSFSVSGSSGGGSGGAAAPEIDPRSAMSAMTLLLGGLAVLRGRRRVTAASYASAVI